MKGNKRKSTEFKKKIFGKLGNKKKKEREGEEESNSAACRKKGRQEDSLV